MRKTKIPKQRVIERINKTYNKIPDTTGCMENLCNCKAWCCKINNPHVLSCEFQRAIDEILAWDINSFLVIIEKALVNYLAGEVTKTCIFFDESNNNCKIHNIRPLACRLYGITPEEEFKEKYDKLLEKYKDNILMIFRPQCNLVKTSNDYKVTKEDTDKWWNEMIKTEIMSGVPKSDIRDEAGGTYLTYHDHILIKMLPSYLMENLSKVRQFGKDDDKQRIIVTILNIVKNSLTGN